MVLGTILVFILWLLSLGRLACNECLILILSRSLVTLIAAPPVTMSSDVDCVVSATFFGGNGECSSCPVPCFGDNDVLQLFSF